MWTLSDFSEVDAYGKKLIPDGSVGTEDRSLLSDSMEPGGGGVFRCH